MLSDQSSRVGRASSGTGSEAPVPGWSKNTMRPSVLMRSTQSRTEGSSGSSSQFVNQFDTKTRSRSSGSVVR
jgi:hypothetical protein